VCVCVCVYRLVYFPVKRNFSNAKSVVGLVGIFYLQERVVEIIKTTRCITGEIMFSISPRFLGDVSEALPE